MPKHVHMRSTRYPRLLRGLHDLCASVPRGHRGTIVEIGCFYGESTLVFAEYFERVVAIDPWEFERLSDLNKGAANGSKDNRVVDGQLAERRFDENVAHVANIVKIKRYDHEVCADWPSVDAVYIDSEHTFDGTIMTAARWWPNIVTGGMLSGHDDKDAFPGVKQAVKVIGALLGNVHTRFEDSSWRFTK